MALLETWRNLAYGDGLDDKKKEELWAGYFQIEKGIYEQILSNPTEVITGTVKDLAEKYNTEILIMTGFLDGINESLKGYENPIDTMEEDTEVKIEIDPSGTRFLHRISARNCISPRRRPVPCARARRFSQMIPVHAEAARNIRSAAERTHKAPDFTRLPGTVPDRRFCSLMIWRWMRE